MMMQEVHAMEMREKRNGRSALEQDHQQQQQQQQQHMDSEVLFVKGEVQAPEYRDVPFAYLFFVQVVGVLLTALFYGPAIFSSTSGADADASTAQQGTSSSTSVLYQDNDDGSSSSSYRSSQMSLGVDDSTTGNTVLVLTVICITSMLSTMGCLTAMTKYAQHIITLSFFAAPALVFALALIFFAVSVSGGSVEGTTVAMNLFFFACLFAAISACVYVWYRPYMPFAASTLKTALAAIECNKGLFLLSIALLFVLYIWTALWFIALAGVFATAAQGGLTRCYDLGYTEHDGYGPNDTCPTHPPNTFAVVLLIFALFWTKQVITNVMHCTTAGTVGSWWFSGLGDPSVCSRDVMDSLMRALTFSFGSICFGSLLASLMETLESQARSARRDRNASGALLACVLECILSFLRQWLEYFNSWAYVYVGLYGYDYITAGRNVMTLFQQRGWSAFIADRLVFRVLYAAQLAVAMVCGAMAALTDLTFGPVFPDNSSGEDSHGMVSHILVFFGGLLLGLILSTSALFVVESAVRTVIVCFAESPAEFQEHHPALCEEMRQGWATAYPEFWTTAHEERFPTAAVLLSSTGMNHSQQEQRADQLQRQESERLT